MYRWGTEKLWAWVCAQHDLNYPPEKALDAPK